MNVYDKAYELARALRDCPEAGSWRQAKRTVNADAEAKRMLDDFRERQNAIQQKMMSGEEPGPAEMAVMNKLYEELNLNPLIRQLFEAEGRFSTVFDDVNRILTEAIHDAAD